MSVPFACDLTAIPPEDRARHRELTRYLVTEAAEAIDETGKGLVLRFSSDELEAVAEFLGYERRCCPFVDFSLRVPSGQQSVLLELSGPDGVTEFLRAELGLGGTGSDDRAQPQ